MENIRIDLCKGELYMAFVYKFDVLEALKKAGYSTYRLRNERY